ncbi:MAG: TlpA family protein disulfide reductase [Planctomycetes bacterium]|nr:TlpA family protein disulfide reductase [Planctomycetota bacterium]
MSGQHRTKTCLWPVTLVAAVILAVVIFSTGCKKPPAGQTNTEPQPQQQQQQKTSLNLNDVVRLRRTWDTAFTSWYGKMAPDFNLTDITGKQHRLSDYRGKDVMLVFWATWCGPCLMEMPDLIELRKTTGQDKLAMLAISYITTMPPNTPEMIKSMVEKRKINYTAIPVDRSDISEPYSQINGIPCSFFVDPEGKIKLATLGVLSLDTIKAILQAEWPKSG